MPDPLPEHAVLVYEGSRRERGPDNQGALVYARILLAGIQTTLPFFQIGTGFPARLCMRSAALTARSKARSISMPSSKILVMSGFAGLRVRFSDLRPELRITRPLSSAGTARGHETATSI